jgi:hypothetical protein
MGGVLARRVVRFRQHVFRSATINIEEKIDVGYHMHIDPGAEAGNPSAPYNFSALRRVTFKRYNNI